MCAGSARSVGLERRHGPWMVGGRKVFPLAAYSYQPLAGNPGVVGVNVKVENYILFSIHTGNITINITRSLAKAFTFALLHLSMYICMF